jgi:hypothetical protein
MRPVRAWVRLESGRRLNLLEPEPASWTGHDLAIGLSRTYRWGRADLQGAADRPIDLPRSRRSAP